MYNAPITQLKTVSAPLPQKPFVHVSIPHSLTTILCSGQVLVSPTRSKRPVLNLPNVIAIANTQDCYSTIIQFL